ncbi:hypothetical protein [Puniceicoccus vermicola]|uniref:Uncharacterized protein n=1 Tax=Puniceicoccus vermicola TaxID=388746 RepID=A0A7X1B162_9BACT|nr:hypothetical protein [Puniceicoccus vermicola]MBC2603689.1 hypothetical protein [Puniceicoccus vermicola]
MNKIHNISGVIPQLAVKASHHPKRTETGIGALMPWADRLWFITYVAHTRRSGDGTGLFYVDDDMQLHKHPASEVGTYANRMVHSESNTMIIGPHLIDTEGNVRTLAELVDVRLTATCRHLTDPANRVYFLGMEGEFFEVNVRTMEVTFLADLLKELSVEGEAKPHFKDAFCNHGRVIVANNSYYAKDFLNPADCNGRLAEWDGQKWTILERTQFNTVQGRADNDALGPATFAFGQDRASALMKVYLPSTGWQNYRLPKATHTQDHAYTTEWPRLREVESERWMLNASGMYYEMPAMTYADRVWGLRPVCSHLRIVGDFCSWNGMLVMAGDQTTPIDDANLEGGQPQANLWFGKTDDLWQWGKPSGWGGPWWKTEVKAGEPSDPYLMTGFEHKCLHVSHDGEGSANFRVEIDFMGSGEWTPHMTITTQNGAASHVFPTGFSAHWIRIIPEANCTATAQLIYT